LAGCVLVGVLRSLFLRTVFVVVCACAAHSSTPPLQIEVYHNEKKAPAPLQSQLINGDGCADSLTYLGFCKECRQHSSHRAG
jgi:hypothetical protein